MKTHPVLQQPNIKQIVPKVIDGHTAIKADYYAHNESIVRVNYFDANNVRIASTIVSIPVEQELTEENVWAAAEVTLAS